MKSDEQAFPVQRQVTGHGEDYWESPGHSGLSKREYFSGLAMQGLLSCYKAQVDMQSDPRYDKKNFSEILASNAVDFADALLKKLSNDNPHQQ